MKVTEKGQVTIPLHVRQVLGIRPGDEVDIVVDDGGARLIRSAESRSLTQRMRDAARHAKTTGLSTDEIMALTRGE